MKKIVKGIFVLLCVLVIIILYLEFSFGDNRRVEVSLDRCVDGDTAWFILNHKKVKVRFLGIDTPEVAHSDGEVSQVYSMDAKGYTCHQLNNAHHIYLEYDRKSNRYDKYDRMLAWVFVDDSNLSELLVSNGYAMVKYIYDDYMYVQDLCNVQREAFQKKLGIWSEKEEEYFVNYCNKKS